MDGKGEIAWQKLWSRGTEQNPGDDGLARRCSNIDPLSSCANMKLKTVCVVLVVIFVEISYCESELEETRSEPR